MPQISDLLFFFFCFNKYMQPFTNFQRKYNHRDILKCMAVLQALTCWVKGSLKVGFKCRWVNWALLIRGGGMLVGEQNTSFPTPALAHCVWLSYFRTASGCTLSKVMP